MITHLANYEEANLTRKLIGDEIDRIMERCIFEASQTTVEDGWPGL